jgi:hypothetical protein
MSKLTHEDEVLLEALRRAKRARDTLPPERTRPIGRPDKYAKPLGMDHGGGWFLAPDAGDEKA